MLYSRDGLVHPRGNEDEMYVDIGAYGTPKARNFSTIPSTRRLEDFVSKVNGYGQSLSLPQYEAVRKT